MSKWEKNDNNNSGGIEKNYEHNNKDKEVKLKK